MKVFWSVLGVICLASCVGCESSAPSGSAKQQSDLAGPPPPAPAAPAENAPALATAPSGAAAQAPAAAATTPATAPKGDAAASAPATGAASDDGSTLKKAEVGVGIKGKDYEPGFITTPIAAKFRIEDRIALDVQIPNAMKIYKAAHNNKGPQTHEEFMDIIIKENGVQLPILAQGESYVYEPKTEELMVKTPKSE